MPGTETQDRGRTRWLPDETADNAGEPTTSDHPLNQATKQGGFSGMMLHFLVRKSI